MLGGAPGAGGGALGNLPGSGAQYLGGRPGPTAPHTPTSVTNPTAAAGPTENQMGIAAPQPQPTPTAPLYGSLSLPEVIEDEGPKDGLTLDLAIDQLVQESLDLHAKFYEIPQAQADILNAGLRANPVFYADGQLVPYGQYSRNRPGGQTQYDVNISYPFDVSHKRQARILVATRAKRVLEAQYQDAVRIVDRWSLRRLRRRPGRPPDGPVYTEEPAGARQGPLGDASSSTRRTRPPAPMSTA